MESQVGKLRRLNAKILEGLRRRVDMLVDELPLNLIRRHGVPPDVLVEVVRDGLQQRLGNVEVSAVLDDLAVNQFGNLARRVFLWSVQLIGLAGGVVVVQHALETGADIDGLLD